MKPVPPPRRKFILSGIAGCCSALLANLPKMGWAKAASKNGKGVVVHQGEGIHLLTGRRQVPITIKISKSQHGIDNISFCMEEMSAGRQMRIHKHLHHDELIFIHQGEGTLTLDE